MARTKDFDPDLAVDAAMRLFWEKGYEATSIADLLAHLGVARASFYDTFGSKHALYVRALDRYNAGAPGPTPLEQLSRPGRAVDAVRALVESYARPPARDDPKGCLIVNAAVECPPEDAVVGRLLDATRHGLLAALTATLLRARAEGDVSADTDADRAARFLLTVLNGMQVMHRSNDDSAATAAADFALRAVGITA